jgi:hypothetical protein
VFQRQCQPHLTETVKESVEGICLKIYHLSADYAKKIKEKHNEVLKENGISGIFVHYIFCTALEILYVAYLYYSLLTGLLISFHISQCCEKCMCAHMCMRVRTHTHTHTFTHSYVYSLSSLQLHCCLQTMRSQRPFHIIVEQIFTYECMFYTCTKRLPAYERVECVDYTLISAILIEWVKNICILSTGMQLDLCTNLLLASVPILPVT